MRPANILFISLVFLSITPACGGSSSGSSTTPSAWEIVGGQVSAADAESQDPVMLLSTPKAGYRHASYQVALNLFNTGSWGTSKGDPSNGNDETFYGPPNFCENDSTIYTAFAHSGDPSSGGADFYDHVLAYSWDETNGWQAMNGGNEVSNAWTGNQWDAYEATTACHSYEEQGGQVTYDMVVAWVEADDASAEDNAYAALVGGSNIERSDLISRNNAVGSFPTDVRVAGVFAADTGIYVAQWENDANDQSKIELYVTELAIPGLAQTPLGVALDVDYDGNTLSAPSLAMLSGNVVVAYSAFRPRTGTAANTRDIYVQRWDGATWQAMGTGPVSAYASTAHLDANNPSLLLIGTKLYIAWEEDGGEGSKIFIASWDEANAAWNLSTADTDIASDVATNALDPSLGYDPDDNRLYVAFEAMISGWPQIYV
jgi:hypothetical protein